MTKRRQERKEMTDEMTDEMTTEMTTEMNASKTDVEPGYYVAWSKALRAVDYWAPLETRGVGKTPEDAVRHAERVCVDWYNKHTVPAGRGREEWDKNLDSIHIWAVYHVWDAYPGVLKDGDPLGVTSVELPGLVVRGIVASLYPGVRQEEHQ